jgi:predicted GTPase
MVVGLAGRGKSSILNTLITGDPYSNVFKTGSSKKVVNTEVCSKDAQILGIYTPVYRFFDVPGFWGGEQDFDAWGTDIIKKMENYKVSLVLIVMSKSDRFDLQTKIAWGPFKDLFKANSPGKIVLTLTRCEDGLDEEH